MRDEWGGDLFVWGEWSVSEVVCADGWKAFFADMGSIYACVGVTGPLGLKL